MKSNYFESISGNKSSSRLIGFIIILFALLENCVVLYLGRADIVQAAIAAGTLFVTIAGSAMAFLFAQKSQEIKQEKNENKNQQPDNPVG